MKRTALILAALLCMASRHPDRMIRSDLLLNASFNRGDGTDRSMVARTPTLAGNAVVTAGQRYLTLDGTGDYVSYPDAADLTFNVAGQDQPFSVCAWFYLSASPSGNIGGVMKASSATTFEWVLRPSSGAFNRPQFVVLNTTASAFVGRAVTTALSSGQWYHMVGTYSGSESEAGVKIYINGAQADNLSVTTGAYTGMSNTTSPVTSGSGLGAEYLNGLVDDVRIYNRELSAAEVAAIYSSGRE